ncbi:Ribosome-binding factor A [Rhynchospora pubera]|uniref:Ribosome-binding factor A n=1 Tax=Rhynchospora pubera TaxID=906938 RepID=A0AAV8GFH1_9POAL|nr:Ribosome-binding factor A [Rhynchospora pubera]
MLLSRAVSSPSLPLSRVTSLQSGFSLASPVQFLSTSTLSLSALTINGKRERSAGVRCMAKEKRVKMVGRQIMRELSEILERDQIVRRALLPEAAFGADLYLSSVTTITDVEVTADLQIAKVYVSVFGDKRGKEVAIEGLKSKAKYIRSQLGKRMRLRITPLLRFIEDDSIERGCGVIALLDELKEEREGKDQDEKKEKPSKRLDEQDEEEYWDDDELDNGGIFFVK